MSESEQLFVEYKGKSYPVVFSEKKKPWLWETENWMNLYIPPENTKKNAFNIENKLRRLEHLAGHRYIKKEMAKFYADEIEANWRIEGEHLDSYQLRSQLINKLGLNVPEWSPKREVVRNEKENAALEGSLFLLNHKGDFTIETLCETHKIIGKGESDSNKKHFFGKFRTSGELVGKLDLESKKYIAYYQAPPQESVPKLMDEYLQWWKESHNKYPLPIGAALAHLYFVIIHPFHDGNGRMARLLTDRYFVTSDEASFRPVNIGATIRTHRKDTQDTLLDISVITGASEATLKGSKFADDMDDLPNTSREPLLPYICTSLEIVENKNSYYNDISQATRGFLNDFVRLLLSFQENAINGAIARVDKIKKMINFFDKAGNKLSKNEKLILRNAFFSDELVSSKINCIADIQDEYEADDIWEKLHQIGLLNERNKPVFDLSLLESRGKSFFASEPLNTDIQNDDNYTQEQSFFSLK